MSDTSAAGSIIRGAGSIWLGVALLAGSAIYLSVVSVFTPQAAEVLRTTPSGVYSHGIILFLGAAICVNLIVATVTWVAFDLARAGTWLAHGGVIVLAAGSVWYALGKVHGGCASTFDGQWTPITHFYLSDTYAAYVGSSGNQALTQNPIIDAGELMNLSLKGAGDDVTLRVTALLPRAVWGYKWRNDSPCKSPAVRLGVRDGPDEVSVTLCPDYPDLGSFITRGYTMYYFPRTSAKTLKKLSKPTASGGGPGVYRDLVLVLDGKEIPTTLLIIRPDGTRQKVKLKLEKAVEIILGGRKVSIKLMETLTNAAVRWWAKPVSSETDSLDACPVLQVFVKCGKYHTITYVPFATYEHLSRPQALILPDGKRQVWLNFSRRRRALPATMQITSVQPIEGTNLKDYICNVRIDTGQKTRNETIRPNKPVKVGAYRLSHGMWNFDDDSKSARIAMLVTTAPGLWLIWSGCALICLALPYAFYVKPLILRLGRQ